MAAQDFSAQKKLGRPPGRTRPETAPIRIPVDLLGAVDAWAADQTDPPPSRPEAVRRALAEHLRAKGYLSGDPRRVATTAADDNS